MKVYFLEIAGSDLTYDPESNLWFSSVIDLYDNASYRNYSVYKSDYGFGPRQETWIGTTRLDTNNLLTWSEIEALNENFYTDSGRVDAGRYVDMSGRIDLISYNVSDGASFVKLTVYHGEVLDATPAFPPDWDHRGPAATSEEIALIDSSRYAVFAFDFGDVGPSVAFLSYIRVEIDRAVAAPLYRSTRGLLDHFPEWMALADVPEEGATPELATPTSLGGSFLNAIAGEWLDDLRRKLSYTSFQQHVTTADQSQMAWAWKSSKLPRYIRSISGDGIELARTANSEEFKAAVQDDACYIDFNNDNLYTTKKYSSLIIDGEVYNQEPHHIWNYFDEIGLFVDLPRLRLEDNAEYGVRILDVYRNRGGVGVDQLKLALRRELSLWKYFGWNGTEGATPAATPDSAFEGATPEILDIEDLEQLNDPNDPLRYFDPDGMPTTRFVEWVQELSTKYPTTWDRFHWGEAIWDVAGPDYSGYNVVPYRYDGSFLPDAQTQSGVGDGNDLFVFRPDVLTGPRQFDARLKVRGQQKVWRTEYPGVEFDLTVRGTGTRDVYDHPEITIPLSVEITTLGATPATVVASFQLTTKHDADVQDFLDASPSDPIASEDSWAIFDIFSEDETTSPELSFVDTATGTPYEPISVADIDSIRLVHGTWDGSTYIDLEIGDTFGAWFSTHPAEVLTYNSAVLEHILVPEVEEATPAATPILVNEVLGAQVVLSSKVLAAAVPTPWQSDEHMYSIRVNGVAPYLAPSPLELDMPLDYIVWDPHVTAAQLELEITSSDPTVGDFDATPSLLEPGGITRNENNEVIFIPIGSILLDGVASWVNSKITVADTTPSVVFSIDTSDPLVYPITFPVWEAFEADQATAVSGVVDENGPWRNGVPNSPGNTSFNFAVTEDLRRSDFGVPETEDYRITWIGVASSNSRVLTWLDTNTVEPAFPSDYLTYPENVVKEQFLEGPDYYYFEPFVIRARVKPGPDKQWSPQVHSGHFYDRNEEYYFYADRRIEDATPGSSEIVLSGLARQGAPIIVETIGATPKTLRQIAFFNEAATITELSLNNYQWVRGTGHALLYLAYHDVYAVSVEDEDGNDITSDTSSLTNEIATSVSTEYGKLYLVQYRVRDSFYADHDYMQSGELKTRLVFSEILAEDYQVNYEGSAYDPATPVDLALNPMYSIQNEAFIFISHNEYTLDSIRVSLSPGVILADGQDYMMVTIDSMDQYGNPKPNQTFQISTDFGTFPSAEITTDHDGFAVLILTSEDAATPGVLPVDGAGTIIISDGLATPGIYVEVPFRVDEPNFPQPSLQGVVKSEKIPADGFSQNIVFGKLLNAQRQPVVGEFVSWHRARSLYELFTTQPATVQIETTSSEGTFSIGPFTTAENEDAGYWFMKLEATVDGVDVGDVVAWYEYPSVQLGVENTDGIPQQALQMTVPIGTIPPYYDSPRFAATYDEQATPLPEQEPGVIWVPPSWYSLSSEDAYQIGDAIPPPPPPPALPAGITLEARWRAGSLSVNNNDPVSTWEDLTGNGNDLIAVVAPTFVLNDGAGRSAVQFSGTNYLDVATFSTAIPQPSAIYAIIAWEKRCLD
jgi:hypothetical protein